MSDLLLNQDEQLDAAMRTHLAAQLDPQRGRARLAFRQHVGLEAKPAPSDGTTTPLRYEARDDSSRPTQNPWWWRRGPWALAMVGSAMAASLLTFWAAPVMWGGHSGGSSGIHQVDPYSSQGMVPTPVTRTDETVRSQLYDGGTIITPDGTPVRRLRRLNLHERYWQNETTGERVKQVVPSEDLMLYEMKTY